MNQKLQCVRSSSLATVFLKAAAGLLDLAGDHGEKVLTSRLVYFDVIEEPGRHFLDLHKKYKFGFESWCLPGAFDADNPEFLIRRLDEGIGNSDALIAGDGLDGSFDYWDVTENHGTACDVELPLEFFGKLAVELSERRQGEIAEYCAQGGGIPFDLSDDVKRLYIQHVKHYGANDNVGYR